MFSAHNIVLPCIRRVPSVAAAAERIRTALREESGAMTEGTAALALPEAAAAVTVLAEPFFAACETLNPWVASFRLLKDLESLRGALHQPRGGDDGGGGAAVPDQPPKLPPKLLRVAPERGRLYAQLAAAPRLWASRRAVGDVHGAPQQLSCVSSATAEGLRARC